MSAKGKKDVCLKVKERNSFRVMRITTEKKGKVHTWLNGISHLEIVDKARKVTLLFGSGFGMLRNCILVELYLSLACIRVLFFLLCKCYSSFLCFYSVIRVALLAHHVLRNGLGQLVQDSQQGIVESYKE